MKKVIRMTESDLTRLVQRVLTEQQTRKQGTAKRFITETMAAAQTLVDDAEEMMASGQKPDSSVTNKVLSCVKQEGFTHLAILTSGAGAYALGLISAVLVYSGAALVLAAAGAILIILEGIGIQGQGVTDEVNRLVKCYNSKK